MKLFIFSLLMAAPTPPGFLLFVFLVSFFVIHSVLKEIFYAHQ